MNSELLHLRTQLTHLMWARRMIRWGCAACTFLAISLMLVVVLFLVDRSFHFTRPWGLLLLPAWIIGLILLSTRFVWPLVRNSDSIDEVALFVESQHDIDNDLIAALQFQVKEPQQQTKLAKAVIQQASDLSHKLDYSKGLTFGLLPNRAISMGIACLVLMLIAIIDPRSWAVFWNRMSFGSAHYPTTTQIDWIAVNGQQVSSSSTTRFQIAQGKSVTLEVRCVGNLPTLATAELISQSNSTRNKLNLMPVRAHPDTYRSELSSAQESCRVVVQAGDASTSAVDIVVVPRPQIDVSWQITQPAYIQLSNPIEEERSNSLQISAFEGSKVQLQLQSQNKRLKKAELTSAGQVWELQPIDDQRRTWTLPTATPFDDLRSNVTCEIHVVDDDDLSLDKPISCEIRLKPDRVPRISATAVVQQVLPNAEPNVNFVATDDFGIARIIARIRVNHDDGRVENFESTAVEFKSTDQPPPTIRNRLPIPLAAYRLAKGDEVRVELAVFDWRGDREGQSSTSEPILFKVTDLAGVLHQIGEEDKKAVKQLDDILKRELSIGTNSSSTLTDPKKE